jgi:hypothetical protein
VGGEGLVGWWVGGRWYVSCFQRAFLFAFNRQILMGMKHA